MEFPSWAEYERLIYSLPETYPQIASSTLRLYSTSALTATVEGSVHLHNGLELRIIEALDFKSGCIRRYSYTVYRSGEKIRWYDSEPHAEDLALASTFPHHLHDLPNIKHNRRPAPGLSFQAPNLPTLIADCITLDKLGR
ncbi:MAG: DUF6516 family protein [Anaerolineae bacterium]